MDICGRVVQTEEERGVCRFYLQNLTFLDGLEDGVNYMLQLILRKYCALDFCGSELRPLTECSQRDTKQCTFDTLQCTFIWLLYVATSFTEFS